MKDKNGYDIKTGDILVCTYFDLDKKDWCLDFCCVESINEITDMYGNTVKEYAEVNCGKILKIYNSEHLLFV